MVDEVLKSIIEEKAVKPQWKIIDYKYLRKGKEVLVAKYRIYTDYTQEYTWMFEVKEEKKLMMERHGIKGKNKYSMKESTKRKDIKR